MVKNTKNLTNALFFVVKLVLHAFVNNEYNSIEVNSCNELGDKIWYKIFIWKIPKIKTLENRSQKIDKISVYMTKSQDFFQ